MIPVAGKIEQRLYASSIATPVLTHRTCEKSKGHDTRCLRCTALAQQQEPCTVPEAQDPPLSSLPGDPSLIVWTNVSMGSEKSKFMKAASEAVALALGKPESFVSVCVMDEQALIFGGTDAPCALAQLNSIGAITLANNKSFSESFCSLISDHGIPENRVFVHSVAKQLKQEFFTSRYYINFFDVPRENVGFKGATFAG